MSLKLWQGLPQGYYVPTGFLNLGYNSLDALIVCFLIIKLKLY